MIRHICKLSCLSSLAVALLVGTSYATNVTTSGPVSSWPVSPEVEVARPDLGSINPDSTSGDRTGTLAQTFQVTSAFDLRTIYLRYKNNDGFLGDLTADFTIYNVPNVLDNPLVLGSAVTTESVIFPEQFNADSPNYVAHIVLDSPVTIPAVSGGTAGYAIEFTNFQGAGGDPAFDGGWAWYRTGGSDGSVYLPGQAYEDGSQKGNPFGDPDTSRDFSLALSSVADPYVPEPSSFLLASLLSLGALVGRSHRI